jgi:DNA (cytosine-5)-methyltransferase 1
MKIYNHIAPKFSDLEWDMVRNIPPGGNWQNIPESVPSKRLEQIRKSGGRTTLYARLRNEKPSYTISTYFNRMGNGCFIHPDQDRLISIREGARLQSFKDSFIFHNSKASIYKQIGNAVPPLLARLISSLIKPHLENKTFVDLFAGAGGMSEGFLMENFELLGAIEIDKRFFETFLKNHSKNGENYFINGDITQRENKDDLISIKNKRKVGVVVGGPPCQGFSLAGWRDPNDKRNQLFKDFVDVVKEIKPEFFVMENVLGILSMRKGEAIKEIIQCFEEIGYHVNTPLKLNAQEFGVPQKRKRVFIIGSLKKIKIDPPSPLFSEDDPKLPNPISVKEAIGSLPPLEANSGEFEIDVKYTPKSNYEKLMAGLISFEEFYELQKKADIDSLDNSSITLNNFS